MTENKSVTTQQANQTPAKKTVSSILAHPAIKGRFEEILGKNAAAFTSSIISAVKAVPALAECDPDSVIASAVLAATLNLPIQSNLGFAHIVPYNSKQGKVAQFQMGYKGYIQLAWRTGQYENINATEIYEGELQKHDRISGEVEIDTSKKKSDKVVGYVAFFKFINGAKKMLYMTKEQIEKHGARYSKSYSNDFGRWKLDFDAMALKTVLKLLLSKYGILSVEMQHAIEKDQAVIKNAETLEVEYVDANSQEVSAMDEKQQEEIKVTVTEAAKKGEEKKNDGKAGQQGKLV